MMLLNIPYNVFANNDIIEEMLINEEYIPLDNNFNIENQENINLDDDLIIPNDNIEYIDSENKTNVEDLEKEEPNEDAVELLEDDTSTYNTTSTLSTVSNITNFADSFAGGNGSKEYPYQIGTALELARLSYLVNEQNLDTTNMYFELVSDINLDGFDIDNDVTNGNWTPIGIDSDKTFKGYFEGANYKISNLNINNGYSNAGLFGMTENASIKNLQIENFTLNTEAYGGLLVGYAYGSIDIVNVKGVNNIITNTNQNAFSIGGLIGYISYLRYNSIHSINIENIELEVNIELTEHYSYYTGGITGYIHSSNNITINNVNIDLSVDGISDYVAGLVGYSYIAEIYKNKTLEIKNISANLHFLETEKNTRYKSYIAGIIGNFYSINNTDLFMGIENININLNSDESSLWSDFGGLIGNINNTILNIKDVYIKGTNNINAYNSGGLIGYLYSSSVTIDNAFVDIDIFAVNYGGGLLGEICFSNYAYISNANYNGQIVGTDINANYRYGGAIADCSSVKDVKILNSNITSILDFECMDYSGGLIGSISNGSLSLKNNRIDTFLSNCKYQTGGLVGFLDINNDLLVEIEKNEINLNINSNNFDSSKIGGIIGQIYNYGVLNVRDNFVKGNIDALSNDRGYFSSIINNSGEISISNIYFISNINDKNSINDRDTYLYSELNGNKINWSNIYYNSDISKLDDNIAIALTTKQMQGLNAKDNMPFDYDSVWKLNRDYYPTFNQLNTAPKLFGEDIELILNQNYNLLDYITVEDFEDKGLIPEVTTDLDITKIGNYTATFTVTDQQGLSDTLTLNIKVVMENPIINAEDIEIFVNEEFDEKKGVTATDVDGTDITEHIKVIENTVNNKVSGEYKVIYEIESLYKNTIQKEIKVTVKAKPIINDDKDKNDNLHSTDKDNNKPSKPEDNKVNTNTTTKPQTRDIGLIGILGVILSVIGINFTNKRKED